MVIWHCCLRYALGYKNLKFSIVWYNLNSNTHLSKLLCKSIGTASYAFFFKNVMCIYIKLNRVHEKFSNGWKLKEIKNLKLME